MGVGYHSILGGEGTLRLRSTLRGGSSVGYCRFGANVVPSLGVVRLLSRANPLRVRHPTDYLQSQPESRSVPTPGFRHNNTTSIMTDSQRQPKRKSLHCELIRRNLRLTELLRTTNRVYCLPREQFVAAKRSLNAQVVAADRNDSCPNRGSRAS